MSEVVMSRVAAGSKEQVQKRRVSRAAVALAASGLALAGCNAERVSNEAPATVSSAPVRVVAPSGDTVTFTFDGLGGGSNVIMVYPGPKDASSDRVQSGTYYSGQAAEAECKVTGREVHSRPELGERAVTSDQWIKVADNGRPEYATAVYIQKPEEVLGQLAVCA